MKPNLKYLHRFFGTLILIPMLIITSNCSTTRNAQQNNLSQSEIGSYLIQQKAEEYTIQSGDEIEVSVWGYDEFNTKRTVTRDGMITIPLLGEVQAKGLTEEELEQNLKEALSEYIKGEINLSITITSSQEHVVSVLGSVGRPDNYTITGDMNLFQVLSQAGGTTNQADLRSIKIYKGGQALHAIEVDLTTYLKNDNAKTVAAIHPGDIIYVPQQENMIRELSGFLRDVVVLFGLFRFFN